MSDLGLSEGTHLITLTASDNTGNHTSVTITVVVKEPERICVQVVKKK